MTRDDPHPIRKRIDELRAILRGLTDPRAIEVLKDEIAALEARIQDTPQPTDDAGTS